MERVELPNGRRAGVHLQIGGGLVKAAERAHQIGASTLQMFSDNPTAWQRRAEIHPDAPEFRAKLAEHDLGPVAIHAPYLVNLAGPDDTLFGRSVELVRHELQHASEYSAAFVNVHIGSHRKSGPEAGMKRLVDGLEMAMADLPVDPGAPLIVLENSSGGGYAIGATIEDMATILDTAGARRLDGRLRFCLDAAHLWGAGYDISEPDLVDEVLELFDRLVGLKRLAMIHMNDSHSPLASRHDKHAHIGEGQIGLPGLKRLLCHPGLAHVAYYLETPEMERGYDAINMARLGDLAAGRPLTPGLEPEPEVAVATPAAADNEAQPAAATSEVAAADRRAARP